MATKMPGAYGEVITYLSRAGIGVDGPAIARYSPAEDTFDVEAGFYVANAIELSQPLQCIVLTAGEAAVTVHTGPYERLPDAYAAIKAWAEEHGRKLSDVMWEEYWSDPQSTPESEWRTDVIWPLMANQ
jgi:effector-binding domain-containing protein